MLKRKMTFKRKKGQSIIEYVLLVTAVVAVLILFLKPDGPFSKAYNATLTTGISSMQDMANRLSGSRENEAAETTGNTTASGH